MVIRRPEYGDGEELSRDPGDWSATVEEHDLDQESAESLDYEDEIPDTFDQPEPATSPTSTLNGGSSSTPTEEASTSSSDATPSSSSTSSSSSSCASPATRARALGGLLVDGKTSEAWASFTERPGPWSSPNCWPLWSLAALVLVAIVGTAAAARRAS